MEKKLRKQQKKLIVRISAILIAVWLILCCAYAAATLLLEKEQQYQAAEIAFSDWQRSMEPYGTNPVLYMDYSRKTAVIGNEEDRIGDRISYLYDHDINLVIKESDTGLSYDSDDIINITFTAEAVFSEYREPHYGFISYQHFRSSISDEQYEKILSYLDTRPKGNDRYELLCTDFYQNYRSELILKTVQIVETSDTNSWYVQDTPVETFELEPGNVDGMTLYHISDLQRNVIPDTFLRGSFGSGGLIARAQLLAQSKGYEADGFRGLLEVSAFEYIYYDFNTVPTRAISLPDNQAVKKNDSTARYYFIKDNDVYYARRIDILESCIRSILTAAGLLFLFFLVIGIIITVMLWRSMKTQLLEEQKRRDMTNALAHDIKTPLFILSGYAGNLKENVQTEKRERYADVIVEQTREVNRRVNRMLELGKLESPGLKLSTTDFDVAELTGETLQNYEALPDGKQIELCTDTPDGKCFITADLSLMRRAVENLVDNAVKYSDRDSVILIRITGKTFEITNKSSEIVAAVYPEGRAGKRTADDSVWKGGSTGYGLQITESVLELHGYEWKIRTDRDEFSFWIRFE